MSFSTLLTETRGATMIIIINRPEAMNALNSTVIKELGEAIAQLNANASLRGAVITGAGDKSFVAGADISEINALAPGQALEYGRRGQAVFLSIEDSPKPVVAAVGGFALGGGCELAMSCHLRIASTKARFGQPEVKLGLIAGYGGTQRLPRLIGATKAIELLLTGDMISAEEAAALGLVNMVCEHGQQVQKALDMLEKIYAVSGNAAALTLKSVYAGLRTPEQGFETEVKYFGASAESADGKEGTDAFLEKRKANFG